MLKKRVVFLILIACVLAPRLVRCSDNPYVNMGSGAFLLGQPQVQIRVYTPDDPVTPEDELIVYGPDFFFNRFILDTGANGLMIARGIYGSALTGEDGNSGMIGNGFVADEAQYEEAGVAGSTLYGVSAAYNLDYAGSDGTPRTIEDVRFMCNAEAEIQYDGIIGMPAMAGRIMIMDMTPWIPGELGPMMVTGFSETGLPADPGMRYTVPLTMKHFPQDGQQDPSDPLPTWAPLPFAVAEVFLGDAASSGDFLFDTGAQLSMINTEIAVALGLDLNGNGTIDEAESSGMVEIGGVGGTTFVPVVSVGGIRLHTQENVDLVWRNFEVLVVDITPQIQGILAMDLIHSGWMNRALGNASADPGTINKVYCDFRNIATDSCQMVLDLNPDAAVVLPHDAALVEVECNQGSLVLTPTATFTVTFDRPVTGFEQADVAIQNASVTGFSEITTGTVYEVQVQFSDAATAVLEVPLGSAQGTEGGSDNAPGIGATTYDPNAATAVLTTTAPSPTATSPIPFTLSFDKEVTGLSAANVLVSNGSAANFSGNGGGLFGGLFGESGDTFTFEVTPESNGEVKLTVPTQVADGLLVSTSFVGTELTIQFNGFAGGPALTLSTTLASPTAAAVLPVDISFDQDVSGFTVEDIAVTNGAAGNFREIGRGSAYAVDITPAADGLVEISVADGAAQGSTGGLDCTGGNLVIESLRTPPTAQLSSTLSSPTAEATIPISITFDQSVTGFGSDGIAVVNGAKANFAEITPGSAYRVDILPESVGQVSITVDEGAAQGRSSLDNPSATLGFWYQPGLPPLQADQVDLETLDVRFFQSIGDPLDPAGYVFDPPLEVLAVERQGDLYRLTTARQTPGIAYDLQFGVEPETGDPAYESGVEPVGFTVVFNDGFTGHAYLGEAEGASEAFDDHFDAEPEDPAGAAVVMRLLNSVTADEGLPLLGGDVRDQTDLNRWYLEMQLAAGGRGDNTVSWDMSGTPEGRLVLLQKMDGESPTGSPVNMLTTDHIAVPENAVYQIVSGVPREVQLELGTGWNLIGSPLISTTPLAGFTVADGTRESRIIGGGWAWGNDGYKALLTTDPLCAEHGYWIFAITGGPCAAAAGLPEDPLLSPANGWNLVSPGTETTGEELGLGTTPIWGWDANARSYYPVYPGEVLVPGQGYWVFIGQRAKRDTGAGSVPR